VTPQEIVKTFGEAIAAVDGNAVAALFTEDGVYHDLVYGPQVGHAAIRDLFRRVNEGGKDYRADMEDVVASDRQAYARYRFSFTTRTGPYAGRRVAIEGVGHFAFKDGLIGHYQETANQGLTLVQLGMEPEKIERVLKRWTIELLSEPELQRHL
jgi:ketosteroid isomerase-like protein